MYCVAARGKARDARALYSPRAEHAVRSRGIRAYYKKARQAAGASAVAPMAAATLRLPWLTPHRDSADSVACHGLIVAVWCPTATRLAALAVGCRKFAPQALYSSPIPNAD